MSAEKIAKGRKKRKRKGAEAQRAQGEGICRLRFALGFRRLAPHPPKTHSHNSKIVFDMGGWRR